MMNMNGLRKGLEKAGFYVVSIGKNYAGNCDFNVELNREGFKVLATELGLELADATFEQFNGLQIENKYGQGSRFYWNVGWDEELLNLLYIAVDVWLVNLCRVNWNWKRNAKAREFVA